MPTERRSAITSATEGGNVRVLCGLCGQATVHTVLKSVEYELEHIESSNFSMTVWLVHQIIQCRGCETTSFRRVSTNTENVHHDPETGTPELVEEIDLFPNRIEGRSEIEETFALPWLVKTAYRETLAALRGSLPVLAGIGIRSIVESVCNDRQATGRTLFDRIDSLVVEGVMTPDGAKVLHSLRELGNDAAHEIREYPIATLNAAMDVVDHLLMGVYVIPQRAARLLAPSGP